MSSAVLDPVLVHIDGHIEQSTEHLFKLLRIPSISTDPAYREDCDKVANWLVEDLESIGFNASKRTTPVSYTHLTLPTILRV